ncbi:trigger factor [Metamycoplasma neophronis]|uniref:Trigger factor n=1 Tax=Metamycoplasma neophronis TaxID=872983 RepID=A0ABY2YZJ6_9BACT|nr:trigger factor [Metamycoplasma neophronis]TPR53361.1 trigger factor [Metamycoplasma neophronis]
MSRLINKEKSELKISYTLEGKEWEEAQEKAKAELRKNVTVQGFRKGKAPAREADKHINLIDILDRALRMSIDKVYDEHIVKEIEKDDEIIGQPSLDVAELTPAKAVIEVTFALFPEVKLGNYKKLGVKLSSVEVEEKDLEAVKKQLASNYVVMLDSEEAIKEGDTVNFDFKGFIDGKEFEGGEAEGFDLVIGSHQFIPGFEEQMVGMKKGEVKDLNLKFPEAYHAKELAGKDVVFNVKVNFVKTPSYPEIDEEFVKQINLPNVRTLKEFEKFVEIQALREKSVKVQNEFIEKATEKLIAESEVTVPHNLVHEEASKYYQNFLNNLKQQQISEKEYLEFSKNTKEEIMHSFEEQAMPNLKKIFIFGAIAKKEKFEVTEADYEAECAKLGKMYNLPIDHVKQILKFENVQTNLINEKIVATLMKDNDAQNYEKFEAAKKTVADYEEEQTKAIIEEVNRKREAAKQLAEVEKEQAEEKETVEVVSEELNKAE